MLETLNRYCHGFVTAPVVVACRQAGFFDLLERRGAVSVDELVRSLGANEGHLRAALRLMESLGWLVSEPDGLRLTPGFAQQRDIPDAAVDLPLGAYLRGETKSPLLGPWIARCEARWQAGSLLMADCLDGVLVIPPMRSGRVTGTRIGMGCHLPGGGARRARGSGASGSAEPRGSRRRPGRDRDLTKRGIHCRQKGTEQGS